MFFFYFYIMLSLACRPLLRKMQRIQGILKTVKRHARSVYTEVEDELDFELKRDLNLRLSE